MKYLKLLSRHEAATPLLALMFATGVGVALVAGRIALTHSMRYTLLVWNLFLAWLPLVFALLACWALQRYPSRRWKFFTLAGAWLLFFPNAPYICTDLIHLPNSYYFKHYWIDLVLVLLCALTGLVLGFVSLYLMQSVVARRFGAAASWLFVAVTVTLGSFGIYLGRFLRLNSWDLFLRPDKVYQHLDRWPNSVWFSGHTVSFLGMFAIFLFLTYVMLFALTHLPKAELRDLPPADSKI